MSKLYHKSPAGALLLTKPVLQYKLPTDTEKHLFQVRRTYMDIVDELWSLITYLMKNHCGGLNDDIRSRGVKLTDFTIDEKDRAIIFTFDPKRHTGKRFATARMASQELNICLGVSLSFVGNKTLHTRRVEVDDNKIKIVFTGLPT